MCVAAGVVFWMCGAYYPNDAPDYARFIAAPESRPLASGHLIWQPLGRAVLRLANAVGLRPDALGMLRALSSIFTVLALLGTWHLAARLGLSRRTAWAATLLAAAFAVTVLAGGSGGTMGAMTACIVAAALTLVWHRPWSVAQGALAVVLVTAAWAFWGIAVFMAPAVCLVAAWSDEGPMPRRLGRAMLLGLACAGGVLATALSAWRFVVIPDTGVDFVDWVLAASHGSTSQPSLLQLVRACYGSLRAVVNPGSLGFLLKDLLLDGGAGTTRPGNLLLWGALAITTLAGLALAVVALVHAATRRADESALRIASIALVAWLPTFGFAATVYGGTEMHMIAGAVPFIALALAVGLMHVRSTLPFAFAALLLVVNVGGSVLPPMARGGLLAARVGTAARAHLPSGSAVVMYGQDITPQEGTLPLYRDTVEVVNIGSIVLEHGVEHWEAELRRTLEATRGRGGGVAVVSDLVGRPTPGGLKLNTTEFARPTVAEVADFFAEWTKGASWRVERFEFVEVHPPAPAPTRSLVP